MKKFIPAIFTAAMFLFGMLYFNFSTKNEYQMVSAAQHDGYSISVPAHAVVTASSHKLLHDTSTLLIVLGFIIAVGGVAFFSRKEYIEDNPTLYWLRLFCCAVLGFCLAYIPIEKKYADPAYETHIIQKNFSEETANAGGYDSQFPEVNEVPLLKQH